MRKIEYRLVIKGLSDALEEKNRQLAEAIALNHDLSEKLAAANVALSVSRKVRDDVLASPGSQYGETK